MTSLDYKEDARDLHAFKELRFFLSHAVQLGIRCSISRLELPLVADFLLGDLRRPSRYGTQIGTSRGDGTIDDESKLGETIRRVVSEPEIVATGQIFSDGQPMHVVPMSSHTPSRYDPKMHAIVWDDVLCFPVRYRDLDLNSRLVITLRGAKDRLVGVASMRFFDNNASLVMGLQKRPFRFTSEPPFAWDPSAPSTGRAPGSCVTWRGVGSDEEPGGYPDCDDAVSAADWGFRLERLRERYPLETLDHADWLDPISLARIDQLVAAHLNPDELKKHRAYQSAEEAGLRAAPYLVIEMPYFTHPILHEERPYPGVPGGGGGTGSGARGTSAGTSGGSTVSGIPDGTGTSSDDALVRGKEGSSSGVGSPVGGVPGGSTAMGMMGAGGRAWGASDLMAGGGAEAFLLVSDYEMEEDNPVEHKYRKLAHDQLRGLVDHELKPNRDERQRIDAIVSARQDHLKMEDRDLIWKFRYCLTDNKRALTKLLLSVDWGVESEVAQVDGLLAQWARQAPIDPPDALKLLGRERKFQAEVVRRFAVDALRRASDEELLTFLLQLVQALRYQTAGNGGNAGPDAVGDSPGEAGGGGGVGGGRGSAAASAPSHGSSAAGAAVAGGAGTGGGGQGDGVSPLAQFLIERACESLELANFFYWYLRVDLEDATHGHIYRGVQAAFKRAMRQNPESARVMDMLLAQDDYVQGVARAHKEACELNGRKHLKDERLRELLKAPNLRRVPARPGSKGAGAGGSGGDAGGGCVPMPLDPTVLITGLEPSTAFLFKSALYPCVIEFTVKHDRVSRPSGGVPLNRTTSSFNAPPEASDSAASAPLTPASLVPANSFGSSTGGNLGGIDDGGQSGAAGATDGSTGSGTAGSEGKSEVDGAQGDDFGKEGGGKRGGTPAMTSTSSWLSPAKTKEKDKEKSYKVIIKSGDDLRQDQLIMQMISLMDSLLKRVNLDLRLMPYGILATGPRHGMVQFVSGSQPVSAVMSSYNGSILDYLRHHNPDPAAPNGVRPGAMQTFVKSTAGYCVITYLLGIGDRHLDNLMLMPAGNLFHIDFGYIFGRDPKPMAPPFRFTREMAEAMGGVNSEEYRLFKTYCCQAYNWLRKSANLILNLLSLMSDAGISELSTDPVAVLAKVEERFRLDLTDEMAEHFFLSLIGQSLQAFAPRVMEVMHQLAVARR